MKASLSLALTLVVGGALYAQAPPSPAGQWRLNTTLTKEDPANWEHASQLPSRPGQPNEPFLGINQPDYTRGGPRSYVPCTPSTTPGSEGDVDLRGCLPGGPSGVTPPAPLTYPVVSAFLFQEEPELFIRMDKPAVLTVVEANGDAVSYQVGTSVSRQTSSGIQVKTKTSFAGRPGSSFGAFTQEFTAAGGFKATRTIAGSPDGDRLFVDFHVASPKVKPAVEDIHRVYDRVK